MSNAGWALLGILIVLAGGVVAAARRRRALARRAASRPVDPRPAAPARLGEDALRAAFAGRTAFIGRNLDFVTLRAGPYTSHGDFDIGVAVYTWVRPGLRVDVWFKDGACTEVKVQDLLD